ncbi:MAG: chromosome partitioning protein ParA, partial [Magnetospirillum sp. WYHS-4]
LTVRAAAEEATIAERAAREAARAADAAFGRARDALSVLKEKAARQGSRLQAVLEQAAAVESDLADARRRLAESTTALEGLPDTAAARQEVERLRGLLGEKRSVLVNSQAAHTALVREAEARRHRLEAVGQELTSWQERSAGAAERLAHLAERRRAVASEIEALAGRPAEIAAFRAVLVERIGEAEARRREEADRLAAAEGFLSGVERDLRVAEGELGRAREEMVRAEGAVEQGKQACRSIAERIAERLECTPEEVPNLADLGEGESMPDLEAVEKRLERLLRERETMGPVNLRAEQEMRELESQTDTLRVERDDLIQAIAKLRQGINELNREGRERLLASFRQVDAHFQELFVRLFGGGRAHLALTESDDPLEAGLEIMASPPGKRLQVLSLLSGGEQALTALALLFGVFLTNPAPICVLDEVDAPLDDANVDRVCSMLEEMARSGRTRFLVITHHRMTMARMDRLFGVTMGERGVSQLVSVDLRQAERIRDAG